MTHPTLNSAPSTDLPAGMVSELPVVAASDTQPLSLPSSPESEKSERPLNDSVHETPAGEFIPSTDLSGFSEAEIKEGGRRNALLIDIQALIAGGATLIDACEHVGLAPSTYCRWRDWFAADGFAGLIDSRNRNGRKPKITFTEEEQLALRTLYLRSNLTDVAGSMRGAAKIFALDPGTRDDLRHHILSALDAGRVPGPVKRCLERVTPAHVEGKRRPGLNQKQHFSGQAGAFMRDKLERRRVVESDDGTLNFAAWIPWPMGGDPCSDKWHVRLGRWQFLPAIECGWSHFYLGYGLVCRPRGQYNNEDVRSVIHLVASQHGLPDEFRFERGAWEANAVVDLLKNLGVKLTTVHQSNHKPYVEGGFSSLWTYLSMIDGQVGRYRGDMERENVLLQACRGGRKDPRDHFPSLDQAIRAIDGAVTLRNSDTINSIYGKWRAEERFHHHRQIRPWSPLPAELQFLFAPMIREWTVTGGYATGKITLMDAVRSPEGELLMDPLKVPYSFFHEDLFRWNSRKVRLYFDPAADPCIATIVSLEDFHGFRPGEVICRAELTGDLPHHARAAVGWATEESVIAIANRKAAMAALRRDLRALDPGGVVKSASTEIRDGRGNSVLRTAAAATTTTGPDEVLPPRPTAPRSAFAAPTAEELQRRRSRLAEQAEQANRLRELHDA